MTRPNDPAPFELTATARRNLETALASASLPAEHEGTLRQWAAGEHEALVARPRPQRLVQKPTFPKLLVAGLILLLVGLGMLGAGALLDSKTWSDFAAIPLWLGSAPVLVTLLIWPFTLLLAALANVVRRNTPFWYLFDGELFAIYESGSPIATYSASELEQLTWRIDEAPNPTLQIALQTKSGESLQHQRIVGPGFSPEETEALLRAVEERCGASG